MKEAKLRMEDALNATRAAVEEGIIAGGGSAYIHAAKEVAKLTEELDGDEKTGARIILKALEAPLYQIAANAGLEGARKAFLIRPRLQEAHCRTRQALHPHCSQQSL